MPYMNQSELATQMTYMMVILLRLEQQPLKMSVHVPGSHYFLIACFTSCMLNLTSFSLSLHALFSVFPFMSLFWPHFYVQ